MEARRQWNYVSKVLKKCKVRILYTTKYLSKETKWKHLHTHKSQRMCLKQAYTTGNDEKKKLLFRQRDRLTGKKWTAAKTM